MIRERRPYHECPECGSAAVIAPAEGSRAKFRCTRCGHRAAQFGRRAFDPTRFDNRPRLAGQVLPTTREIDE